MNGNLAPGSRYLRDEGEFDFAKNRSHRKRAKNFEAETGSELPVRFTSYPEFEQFCSALFSASILRGRGC